VRRLILGPQALEDLQWWAGIDKRVALKILRLLEETVRSPFADKGKPEALKFDLSGCWSRRIDLAWRIVSFMRSPAATSACCLVGFATGGRWW